MMFLLMASLALAPAPVVWSDAETLTGWTHGPTLIDDARVGDHAVRYHVPPGTMMGPGFDYRATGVEPTAAHLLTFWYRVTGTGRLNLMIKLISPLTEGWQGTWEVDGAIPADGQWRKGIVDLGTDWMQWGESPQLDTKLCMFRLETDPGSQVDFDVDQVQLEAKIFRAEPLGSQFVEGRPRASVRVENLLAEPIDLVVAGAQVSLAANTAEVFEIDLGHLSQRIADLAPLAILREDITVELAGQPESQVQLPVDFGGALRLPPNPRLLITKAEVDEIKARAAADEILGRRLASLLADADRRLEQPIDLPDRGSQWWHWYACEDDGGNLRTLSPTEHQCTTCERIYSGYPYDDVVLASRHSDYAARIRVLGLAYQLTGDVKYAQRAGEVLLAYAAVYDSYPLHNINGQPRVGGGKVGPQTLDESTWLIPVCQGADLVWETLSEADRATIANDLLRPAAEVIRQHKMGVHNIQCWKNSAVGLVGLLLDDAGLVADAVRGPSGYENQISGINLDGQWYEGAWGYHTYTMNALVPLTEAAERCGLDLYAFERGGKSLRLLFDGPLDLGMPNRVLPNFSDSGYVNLVGMQALYEIALRRYGDPRYAQVIADGSMDTIEGLLLGVRPLPEPAAAGELGGNYLAAGYSVLRNSPGDDATWACLKWGPYGGGHGHPDKLSLILYSQGKVFGLDPGTARYGVPIQAGWMRTSIAHNTLVVDQRNQGSVDGSTLGYASGPGWTAAIAHAGPIYAGVDYRRAAALVGDDLLLLLDLVESEADHTYDLPWHLAGTWDAEPTGPAAGLPDDVPGYSYLQDMVQLADGAAVPGISFDPLKLQIAVTGLQPGQVLAGNAPTANVADRHPITIWRTRGQEATVGWAISLDGTKPELNLEPVADGYRLTATTGTRTATLVVRPDAPEDQRLTIE